MVDHFINVDPVHGDSFCTYLRELHIKLTADDENRKYVLIMDNATPHKTDDVNAVAMTKPNIRIRFLPPYSPFLNSIENCFSK